MNVEEFRDHCLKKEGITESFPFGGDTLVFKAYDKMFALSGIDDFEFINLKQHPEKSAELRDTYQGIKPGWHMNKTHWNSVYTDMDVPDVLIKQLIDDSYDIIKNSIKLK